MAKLTRTGVRSGSEGLGGVLRCKDRSWDFNPQTDGYGVKVGLGLTAEARGVSERVSS